MRIVDHVQRLAIAIDFDHGSQRRKHFFAIDTHVVGGVQKHPWCHEIAVRVAGQAVAPTGQFGTFGFAQRNIGEVFIKLLLANHGAKLGTGGQRMTHL